MTRDDTFIFLYIRQTVFYITYPYPQSSQIKKSFIIWHSKSDNWRNDKVVSKKTRRKLKISKRKWSQQITTGKHIRYLLHKRYSRKSRKDKTKVNTSPKKRKIYKQQSIKTDISQNNEFSKALSKIAVKTKDLPEYCSLHNWIFLVANCTMKISKPLYMYFPTEREWTSMAWMKKPSE